MASPGEAPANPKKRRWGEELKKDDSLAPQTGTKAKLSKEAIEEVFSLIFRFETLTGFGQS